ncbi:MULTISPECIES: mandelate racemase/muconate lactonizing enzyme family protein [unclassified Roseitalea]|uniref:mandelate racemase/muconate lactonizing enzyme family protein n=1 Tax=unclassified Roseitalea TaxID=2639107 RepID=UPI00273E8742|nr:MULTISPECIES: mandelate racemase/muconate lactonizing enzyme family protein [unclassified Roseitalea]
MKITDVAALYLRLPTIKARTDSSQDTLLVRVDTDAGVTGWGEVDGCPWVAKAIIDAPMSHTLVTGLRNLLVGEDPMDVERLWTKMYEGTLYYGREGAVIQAMAGVDLALWDIKGKALDQPVWRLLGGRYRDRLRVYSSNMFQFTAEETADRLRKAKDEGFTAVKFGWEPFGRDAATDCAYLEALRKAGGDDYDIMVDVGLIWDAPTTIQRARLFEPYDLTWIEEPMHPDNLAGYKKVSDNIVQRLAAGEEECTQRGFARLIEEGGIGLAQIDLTRCGLTQAMKIADHAAQKGVMVANHNFTTDLNTAASLTFLAAVPNALMLEYCVEPSEISRNLARKPFRQHDGYMAVPEEPGLGFEPNFETIETYLVEAL